MKTFLFCVCIVVGFAMVNGTSLLGYGKLTNNKSRTSNNTKYDQYGYVPAKTVSNFLRGSDMYRGGPSKNDEKHASKRIAEL